MEYIWLLAGLILLLYSGKYLINGSVALSERLGLSKLVIGVTVVSFGTSAPELFVSLIAALKGHSAIAIGNVVGSNISNIALVLAITALIIPIPVKSKTIKVLWPIMMFSSLMFYVFFLDLKISRTEGIVFVAFLIVFVLFSVYNSNKSNNSINEEKTLSYSLGVAVLLIVISSVGLAIGSQLLVNNAVIIAEKFQVSERVISITLIAVGTSLPELVASVMAAFKKEMDISVGNIVGSNIFNIWAVLGITGIIQPIVLDDKKFLSFDVLWMLGISFLLFLCILPLKGGKITRGKGFVLLLAYAVYLYLLIVK